MIPVIAGSYKRRDQRDKDVCQLSQRVAHRSFVFCLRLRFGAFSVVNRHACTADHQRAHGIDNLRRLARPDDQLVLLPLFHVATDAGQLLQTRHVKLIVVMHLDAHARHAVFQTLNIFLPAYPLQDIAGERCCFVHKRLC